MVVGFPTWLGILLLGCGDPAQPCANGGEGGGTPQPAECCQGGGGGGGSGGAIHLAAPTISVRGSVSAVGGRGGASRSLFVHSGGDGGDGGLGRVRLSVGALDCPGTFLPPLPPRLDGTANSSGATSVDVWPR